MRHALDISCGAIRLVAADTTTFDAPGAYADALARVSEERRKKALSFRFEKDRRVSLLAGLLLNDLLSERGLAERDMEYVTGPHGKPAFAKEPGLHFSLAHSGLMAAAALAPFPVGVDIERLDGFPRDIADPQAWTAMEGAGKATGQGIGAYVDAGVETFSVPAGFRVEHYSCDGYLVCLAFDGLAATLV